MPRNKSGRFEPVEDKKQRLILWLPGSLAVQIEERATQREQSPAEWVTRVLEAQFPNGGTKPTREQAAGARPKPTDCRHPLSRRIGHTCGVCFKDL